MRFILLGAMFLACGCSPSTKLASTAATSPTALTGLPLTVTLKQRTNLVLPGSDGLRLTIDDITRGQVMASLAAKDGTTLLAPVSLMPGNKTEFKLGGATYTLTLKELNNALLEDDFATFVITGQAAPALSEKEKIEKLIVHVEQLDGATFTRNGTAHTAKEAADHLRTKWQAAGDRVTTAREFIDHLATKSSTSGEPYTLKLPTGVTHPAGQYLSTRLAEIEKQ